MTLTHKLLRVIRALGLSNTFSYFFKLKVLDPLLQHFHNTSVRGFIRVKKGPYPLMFRYGSSDPSVFWQVFVREDYKPCCFGNPRIIFDCGANVGYSTAYFANLYPRAHIICLEPDLENFKMLQNNLSPFGRRVETVQQALWSKSTSLSLIPAEPGTRGEWGVKVQETRNGKKGNVASTTIEDLLRDRGLDCIDILKVDVEGAELEIFSEEDCYSWIHKVKTIIIELHGKDAWRVFRSTVERAGFHVTALQNGMAIAVQSAKSDAYGSQQGVERFKTIVNTRP